MEILRLLASAAGLLAGLLSLAILVGLIGLGAQEALRKRARARRLSFQDGEGSEQSLRADRWDDDDDDDDDGDLFEMTSREATPER